MINICKNTLKEILSTNSKLSNDDIEDLMDGVRIMEEARELNNINNISSIDGLSIKIFEIKDNVRLSFVNFNLEDIADSIGDILLIYNDKVYCKSWDDNLFHLVEIHKEFIESNEHLFRVLT